MFQFPWFPRFELCVRSTVRRHAPARVSPFGYLRLNSGCTRLPGAFRSVPRPSSARDAQAFPIRPGSFSSKHVLRRSFLSRVTHFFTSHVFSHYALGKELAGSYEPAITTDENGPTTRRAANVRHLQQLSLSSSRSRHQFRHLSRIHPACDVPSILIHLSHIVKAFLRGFRRLIGKRE